MTRNKEEEDELSFVRMEQTEENISRIIIHNTHRSIHRRGRKKERTKKKKKMLMLNDKQIIRLTNSTGTILLLLLLLDMFNQTGNMPHSKC